MQHEYLSIETASDLANYKKMKQEVKELKAFVKAEIQDCRLIGQGAFECCVEELQKVKKMLDKIDTK